MIINFTKIQTVVFANTKIQTRIAVELFGIEQKNHFCYFSQIITDAKRRLGIYI